MSLVCASLQFLCVFISFEFISKKLMFMLVYHYLISYIGFRLVFWQAMAVCRAASRLPWSRRFFSSDGGRHLEKAVAELNKVSTLPLQLLITPILNDFIDIVNLT